MIKGLHHVSMKCDSKDKYEEVLDFYSDVLELRLVRIWEAGAMFDTGNGRLEIFNNAEDSLPQGTIRHFAFDVTDTDECAARVREAGYEVFDGPRDVVIPSEPPLPARIAFARGPLGEEIEFFQEL